MKRPVRSNFDLTTFKIALIPLRNFWYSVLLHNGVFWPKHGVTKLYNIMNIFSYELRSSPVSQFRN
jgi:hypothetical protein